MAVLLGSDGGSPFPTMFFQQSITWACPVAMDVLVYVIGAGGSGAADKTAGSSANGGGAGGCAVSRLTLAAQNYTLTIGSGGTNAYTSGYYVNGTAGGNTSMSGSGMTTMTGNGGGAGTYSSNVAVAGGSASGGTLQNNTGGGTPAQADTTYGCSGGGGVGLYGPGQDGTVNTSNGGYPAGGSPIGIAPINLAATSARPNTIIDGYLANGTIGVDIFPGLSRTTINEMAAVTDSTISVATTTGGNIQIYSGSQGRRILPTGPFTGGAGIGAGTSQNCYAGGGTSGGGGGGCNTNDYGGHARSGGGGGGLIIMIPLSMGA